MKEEKKETFRGKMKKEALDWAFQKLRGKTKLVAHKRQLKKFRDLI